MFGAWQRAYPVPSAPPTLLRKDLDPEPHQLHTDTGCSDQGLSDGSALQNPRNESLEMINSVHVTVCICRWVTDSGILKILFCVSYKIAVSTWLVLITQGQD